ncbi:hypothetical protein [Streptomyces sp. NBC_00228]|nr:hypothetical protein [Streptomyces sp. NBC_00228]
MSDDGGSGHRDGTVPYGAEQPADDGGGTGLGTAPEASRGLRRTGLG